MARLLYRLGHLTARHRWIVIGVWIALAAAISVAHARFGAETNNDLSLPGTGSQRALDILTSRFPSQANGSSPIVFHVDEGTLKKGANRHAMDESMDRLKATQEVLRVVSPFSKRGQAQIADKVRTAYAQVVLSVPNGEVTLDLAESVFAAADPARQAGIEVAAGGIIGSELSADTSDPGEVIGLGVAVIILTFVFGSVVAMGLPIGTALIGLVGGLGIIALLGHAVTIPTVAPTLATMIGLGVGIDYALFMVTRHKDQLKDGVEMRESIARATATSGAAIVFAGGTVVIALLSLAAAGIPIVTTLGFSAAIMVFIAVIAAITLLPALLSAVGRHIDSVGLPKFLRRREKDPMHTAWASLARWVGGHPVVAMLIALTILAPLIVPMFSLELGQEDVGATPLSTTQRQAYDLISSEFGEGENGPLLVSVDLATHARPSERFKNLRSQALDLKQTLKREQRELTRKEHRLKERGARLQGQGDELRFEESTLEGEEAALQGEAAQLEARAEVLVAEGLRLAVEARGLERLGEALEAFGARILAAEARVREAIERSIDPRRRARLQRVLALLGQREAINAQRISEVASRLLAVESAGDRVKRELAALAAQGVSLAQQGQALAAEGARLQQEGAELQREGTQLKREERRTKKQARHAKRQKRHAKQLQATLTNLYIRAAGDPRALDPRLDRIRRALRNTEGIDSVSPVAVNVSGDAAVISVIPDSAPAADRTASLVQTVRSSVLPPAVKGSDVQAFVGGTTASYVDLADEISARLPLVIGIVIALSFVLLLLAFQSIAIPIKAAVMNLLSVTAAYGILTAVFQWGWGVHLLGLDVDHVPIASYVPLMMFAVLFGLSMDYEVFLMSRIKEHHDDGQPTREAVVRGLATSARVITSAALIMVTVFAAFIASGDPTIKQFGVGLSVAVALDATIVRSLLVPAALVLLGERAWWLPRWLARILPRMNIEGGAELAGLTPPDAAAPAVSAQAVSASGDGERGPETTDVKAPNAKPAPRRKPPSKHRTGRSR